MTTVGIRELRQRASELLRRVQAGETIEVTDRGRPVAVLAPLPEAEPLERLRAAGEVVRPAGKVALYQVSYSRSGRGEIITRHR